MYLKFIEYFKIHIINPFNLLKTINNHNDIYPRYPYPKDLNHNYFKLVYFFKKGPFQNFIKIDETVKDLDSNLRSYPKLVYTLLMIY